MNSRENRDRCARIDRDDQRCRVVHTEIDFAGCDRLCCTPDGKKVYVPSGTWSGSPEWKTLDGPSGRVTAKCPRCKAWVEVPLKYVG